MGGGIEPPPSYPLKTKRKRMIQYLIFLALGLIGILGNIVAGNMQNIPLFMFIVGISVGSLYWENYYGDR